MICLSEQAGNKAASLEESEGQHWAAFGYGRLTDVGWQVHRRRSLRYKRSAMKNDDLAHRKLAALKY